MNQSNWRLARPAVVAAWVCVLSGCGGTPTRYFSVFMEGLVSAYGAVQPDSCYRSASVAQGVTSEERAADQFCQVPTKPPQASSGYNLTSVYTAESWSILEVSPDEAYLARTVMSANGSTYRMGIGGKRSKTGYDFSGTSEQWVEYCLPLPSGGGYPAPLTTVCNGTCVTTISDPANCGTCGRVCAAGQACLSGNCVAACPTMQSTCFGVAVDLNSDRNNCGLCGRACEAGTECRFMGNGGGCVPAGCGGICSAAPLSGCGAPTRFARVMENNYNLELAGKDLRGVAWTITSFSCANGGCAADFADRCPSCSVGVKVLGSETTAAQEVQPR